VLAIVALLLAAPFERGRDCSVCPADCPMHAARRGPERAVGCHHGTDEASAPRPGADGACAMRASCGHHGEGVTSGVLAELPPALIVAPYAAAPHRAVPAAPLHVADGPAPPDRPPRSSVV
jgi:hypothetical protein